jgi:rapamycin-insensitive companion of mTOR
MTVYRRSRQPSEMQKDAEPHDRSQEVLKLTDQYMALLLLLLTNAGLLDVSIACFLFSHYGGSMVNTP